MFDTMLVAAPSINPALSGAALSGAALSGAALSGAAAELVANGQLRSARSLAPLPVHPGLETLLPQGLRRGSTVHVAGSLSLSLALLGAASGQGSWCATVGLPLFSAEAAVEYGIALSRMAVVPRPAGGWTGSHWVTAVGALVDAVDIVLACPPGGRTGRAPAPAEIRRLTARVRTKSAVLVTYQPSRNADSWPGAEIRLSAGNGTWEGIGSGYGRLTRRRLTVTAEGRGQASRPRQVDLYLPAAGGGVQASEDLATVTPLSAAHSA